MHLADFPRADADLAAWADELDTGDFGRRWAAALALRDQVNERLEAARQQKAIGKSLEAEVTVQASRALHDTLAPLSADLPMLFNVSSVVLEAADGREGAGVEVRPAPGDKCPRCWRYVRDVVTTGASAGICRRCADATGDPGA